MKSSNILLTVLGAGVVYSLLGGFVLANSNANVEEKSGVVWTQIQRGSELLPRVEKIVKAEMSDRKDILTQIAQARSQYQTSIASRDLEGALRANDSFKLIVENNQFPSGLPQLQTNLMSQTEGTFNRITYARTQLIEAQTSYNKTRNLFFLNQLFTDKQEVLGASSNPAQTLPESQF